ncbi:MAG TPA: hypothetical protein VGM03_12160 [Phycisphaerae bacterium]|jgi:hypothetical protein
MKRTIAGVAVLACAVAAAACRSSGTRAPACGLACPGSSRDLEGFPEFPAAPGPALLFDARPGELSPDGLIYRSDWPSTASAFGLGETIYYEEYFNDYQALWPFSHDYTTRQFRTYRTGAATR